LWSTDECENGLVWNSEEASITVSSSYSELHTGQHASLYNTPVSGQSAGFWRPQDQDTMPWIQVKGFCMVDANKKSILITIWIA